MQKPCWWQGNISITISIVLVDKRIVLEKKDNNKNVSADSMPRDGPHENFYKRKAHCIKH